MRGTSIIAQIFVSLRNLTRKYEMKFKQSNLLEWNFKPEIKIGIKTIKTEIKTIILKSEWKLKRNKKEKKIILEI